MGKVEKYLVERLEKEKLIFALIDPLDYKNKEDAVRKGIAAAEGGAAAVLIGGSIGVQGDVLDYVVKSIKEKVEVPTILFPGNIATVTKYADAVYFMSLLNSRNPYWITGAQALASGVVKSIGIEPLSVGYIVVEPGGSVGWIGDANLVPRNRPRLAAALALAGQYIGSHFILIDAGSASKLGPAPNEIVSSVKKTIDIPLIIGGGVRTVNEARMVAKAGADIIQVGTIIEKVSNPRKTIESFVKAINK